jgi:cobalamin-dependent methionine synthase I
MIDGNPSFRGNRTPAFVGIKSFADYPLAELADCIDWTPFFQTWELTGRFAAIVDDAKVGEVARSMARCGPAPARSPMNSGATAA